MRHLLGVAVVAAALASIGPRSAVAQTAGPPTSIDPGSIEIGGWDRSVAATGTTYYRCQAQECGRGSLVSVRPAAERPTLPALEANTRNIARVMGERLGPSARVVVGKAQGTGPDKTGLSVGQIAYDFHGVDAGAGISPAWSSGFVAGPRAAFTVGSSAATRDVADRNMKVFQSGLMPLAAKAPDSSNR